MADIAMCTNKTCPDRLKCYRFTATPNPYRQSYSGFQVEVGANRCEEFMDNYVDNPKIKRSF